ncbi:hypothetical protein B0H10DRAFT_2233264 [Mycena sp. CBHHK59/15]|nr:hypothetical protein B0H10DRAFT_2233264 [Mycena sp. CBHHK59/15]
MYPSRSTTALSRTAYTHPIDPARPAHALDNEDTAHDTEHGYTFFASHPPHPRLLTARNIACSFIPHILPTSDVFHPILPHWNLRNSGCALRVCTPRRHLFSMSQSSVSTPTCIISQFDRPAQCAPQSPRTSPASPSTPRLAHPQPLHPTSHIPNYRECGHVAFLLTAAAAPMLLVPHIAAPIPHRPCTDAQHPAMCSTPACVYRAPWPPLLPP